MLALVHAVEFEKMKITNQNGSSMIEVIIAIVITVMGLLGVAGLQLNALKYQKTSAQRSEAMQAAYDIGERMRANAVAAKASAYIYTTSYSTTVASPPTLPTCTAPCSAAQIAAIDQAEWLINLSRRLLGGAGFIVSNVNGGVDVTVMWKEPSLITTDPACGNTPTPPGTGVRCFVVTFTP